MFYGIQLALNAIYPAVPPDRAHFHRVSSARPAHAESNTILKLLHMLRWAAANDESHPDREAYWFCRLERDTFFVPENFRLLVWVMR